MQILEKIGASPKKHIELMVRTPVAELQQQTFDAWW